MLQHWTGTPSNKTVLSIGIRAGSFFSKRDPWSFEFRFDEMDFKREGASVQRPPLLDGTDFSYWKARMKAFIKSMDEKAWRAILTGWKHPMTTNDKNEP